MVILEAGATLTDPAFATGFIVWSLVLVALAVRTAIALTRTKRRALEILTSALPLLAVASYTRRAIETVANLVVSAFSTENIVVHYWFMKPYVQSVWTITAVAFIITAAVRMRRGARPVLA